MVKTHQHTKASIETFKSHLSKFKAPEQSPTSQSPKRQAVQERQAAKKSTLEKSTKKSTPPKPAHKSPQSTRKKPTRTRNPTLTSGPYPPLPDLLTPSLISIFIGTNPGLLTSTLGHTYAHPTNLFWRLLHSSGCTDVLLRPTDDVLLPTHYLLGNTNLVARPTRNAGELTRQELKSGVGVLEKKVRRFKPESVCFVGKGNWEVVVGKKGGFEYGWQEELFGGTRVFVAPSTSGLAAHLTRGEKERIWGVFGGWVQQRRGEREREK
ncbi:DNA glycosylase, partial [Piedraia hortae CBS 480.64]